VLFTAGYGLMVFALLYYFIEIRGHTRWVTPLLVYGSNSILVFVLSGLFARILLLVKMPGEGGSGATVSLYTWLYTHAFQPWAGNYNGSLAFALTYVLLFFGLMAVLYRRGWFLRI